jgi:galactosylceramidase
VKLHGFGNWGKQKMDFLKHMQEDKELRDALDAVCAHTFSEIQLTPEERKIAENMGKPIWNSEDHVYLPGFDCLISIVHCFNQNYIVSGATKVINWYDIGATYPLEPYSKEPPMLLAQEPWSGHYTVRDALWGYAHYGQFTRVGWRYIDDGCMNLSGGGSMVTMRDPQTADYSIIVETKGAKKPQTSKVKIAYGLSTDKLCVWYSDSQQQFVRLKDITPKGGSFSFTMKPDAVYSLSTTTGQQKGSFENIPTSKPFPIPYEDNFEQYTNAPEWGYLPHYLADLIGCFELRPTPAPNPKLSTFNSNTCLQQVVGSHTLSWAPEWHHYTIIGDASWTDYEVSADVYLNPGDEAGVMGRLCDVGSGYGVWAKGYFLKMDENGKVTLILTRGKRDQKELIGDKEQQAIILARKDVEIGGEYTLAEATVNNVAALQWHNLKLRFLDDQITGYVDGVEVVSAKSDHYGKGMAGLIRNGENIVRI